MYIYVVVYIFQRKSYIVVYLILLCNENHEQKNKIK